MPVNKSRIKLFRSLHHARGRRDSGLFLVEGPELVKEALQEGWPLDDVLITHSMGRDKTEGRELRGLLELADVPYNLCSQYEMERMSEAKTPQGVIALARLPIPDSSFEEPVSDEILLICECVSDPGNLGTILRTADWFGVHEVVLGTGSADPFSPKVVRASAGSIFRVNTRVVTDLNIVIERELGQKRRLYAATMKGELLPDNLPDNGLRALVIGHEKRGVSPEIAELCIATVRVQGYGHTESLNLTVAAGILLHSLCSK